MSKKLSINIEDEAADTLDTLAEQEGTPTGTLAKKIIENYIANPTPAGADTRLEKLEKQTRENVIATCMCFTLLYGVLMRAKLDEGDEATVNKIIDASIKFADEFDAKPTISISDFPFIREAKKDKNK